MNNNVALIFGGSSTEHNASLKSFAWVYKQIQDVGFKSNARLKYIIYINRQGEAVCVDANLDKHSDFYSKSNTFSSLADVIAKMKKEGIFVYSCLHGANGEDGRIQGMADVLKINGAFGGFLSCAISMDKYHMNNYIKARFKELAIPETISLSNLSSIDSELGVLMGKDIVVKPASLGASIFTEKLNLSEQTMQDVKKLIGKILEYDEKALVQEFVSGTEYSCGCLENGNNVEVLPLVRIETKEGFFGHKEKHVSGEAKELLIDVNHESSIQKRIKNISKEIFEDLGFQNLCRIDFIESNDVIYFLEVNGLPGLMEHSIFPKMLKSAGYNVVDLIEISLKNAENRKNKSTKLEYKID